MVIVIGQVEVDPLDVNPFVQAVREVEAATRREEGCFSYAFGQDVASPHRFWLCETWSDDVALAEHLNSAHIASFRAAIASLRVLRFVARMYNASGERTLIDN